jgi:hypothetical protein
MKNKQDLVFATYGFTFVRKVTLKPDMFLVPGKLQHKEISKKNPTIYLE